MESKKDKRKRITLIILLIVGAACVLYSPIYYYADHFGKNKPSENPSDWGPFGDFFGGILNPIISFFTLIVTIYIAFYIKKIEDKRSDRAIEASYKPDLIIEERYFYIRSNAGSNIPIEFTYERENGQHVSPLNRINDFYLILLNIGLGPAKRVSITYEIDLVKIASFVNQSAKEAGSNNNITANFDPKIPSLFEFNQNIGGLVNRSANAIRNQSEQKINHILSITHSTDPYHIEIPHFILEAYSALIFNWWNKQGQNSPLFKFPAFSVNIKYLDIGDKPYEKKYQILMDYNGGSHIFASNKIEITYI